MFVGGILVDSRVSLFSGSAGAIRANNPVGGFDELSICRLVYAYSAVAESSDVPRRPHVTSYLPSLLASPIIGIYIYVYICIYIYT